MGTVLLGFVGMEKGATVCCVHSAFQLSGKGREEDWMFYREEKE